KEQLREMSQAGWTIASHTRSHPYLTGLNQEQRKAELEGSRIVLEEILGQPVRYIAYPYGVYDQNIIDDCKSAGYTMAFTIERGWASSEDPFRLKRVYCYANMGLEELKRRIEDPIY
ncbi:MAG: polysaccharide deacetylase family protein, partial [Desulfitobacterium sp.]|nr:polysaccharide deacetylase family protein [Desulfitobacterium sp.]